MIELIRRKTLIKRSGVAYIAAAVFFAGVPMTAFAAPAVDIKINGSDGPVTITDGEEWSYSWTSSDATACEFTSPSGVTGVTLAGNGGPITSSHPWYPDVGGSTTLTIDCTQGTISTSDSVTINVIASTPPDDGGGEATTTLPTVDVKINASDGPVTITDGEEWSYSWTSSDATACELTSPSGVTGVTLAGNGGPISKGHSWYPAVGGSTTLTLDCTNGVDSVSDSATINIVSGGGGGGDTENVSADIDINGSDGPVTITEGEEWNYSWTSSDATACEITSPSGVSGVTLAGNGGPITTSHDWYPEVGGSTTLTLDCTNGTDSASDSVTINVVAEDEDNGGGGGGGGGGHHHSSSNSSVSSGGVTAPVPVGSFCPYLSQYMRIDFNNDVTQVIRLQSFLKTFEGHSYVTVNGVFDEATRQAVNEFQLKYSSEVLAPWGINQPTGYVYLLTLRKINEIICGPQAAITVPQQHEIDTYVPPKEGIPEVGKAGSKSGSIGSASVGEPIIGEVSPGSTRGGTIGSIKDKLAAALFAGPQSLSEMMQCLYEFVLLLIVLYILGSVLESVLYKDNPENVRKRFFTKWGAISAGLVVAMVGAYMLEEWCLILPLFITLVASVVWMFFYPKHGSIKAKAAAWQTSVSSRTKKLLEETKESIEADQKAAEEKREG